MSSANVACYMVAAGQALTCGIRFFGPFETRELAEKWVNDVFSKYNLEVTEIVVVYIAYKS